MAFIATNGLVAPAQLGATVRRAGWPPALFALSLGSFALGTTEFLPAALLPTIASDLKVTVASAGLLISGYALGVTLLTPALTAAFSGYPRKKLLMALMGAFFVTNVLAAFAPGFSTLLVMRFLTAFSHGVYFAAASTAAASLVAKGREAQAISILFAGLTIAMATIVPTGAFIGQILGWRFAFAATGCLGLITMIGIAIYVPALPISENRLSLGKQLSALRHPGLLVALAITTIGYAGTFTTLTYLAATLEQISGFSPFMVTILFGVLGAGVTVGNLLGGRAADFGIYPAVAGLYALNAVSLLALWFGAPYPAFAVAALIFFSVVMFSPGAGLQLMALRQAARCMPGSEDVAAGLNQSAFNLGIAIGAFIGSQIVASSWGLAATPGVSVLLLLAAVALTAWAWRRDAGNFADASASIGSETDAECASVAA